MRVTASAIRSFRLAMPRVVLPTLSRSVKALSAPVNGVMVVHGIDPVIRSDPNLPTVSRG
jgi:hypothetical protein